MPQANLPLGIGSNLDIDDSSARDQASVQMVNCYVDRVGALRTIPAFATYADLGTASEVYSWYSSLFSVLVIVSAGRVWVQSSLSGALSELTGVQISASSRPCFAEDKNSIFFAANSGIHQLNPSSLAVHQLGPLTPQFVTSLAFIGGYLKAVGETGGGGSVPGDTHYSDDIANDYAAWEVYNNESRPDAMMAMVVAYEQVYNIGRNTLEVTYIDGTVPFSVNKNAAQHFGTPAADSVVFDGESIYYLSEVTSARKIIKLAGGGAPQIISFPIDIPLEEFERVSDANGYIMAFRGQNFYCIDFPTANVRIADQFWPSITLVYHIQRECWLTFAEWDTIQGQYLSYLGVSFCYASDWDVRLVGGRDGKLYKVVENETINYLVEPKLTHAWRDDNSHQWRNPRTINLKAPGDSSFPGDQYQCGQYRNRQHNLIYTFTNDDGEVFRAEVLTGHINHGRDMGKRAISYRYNVNRGANYLVINSITETFDHLRR